MEEERKVYENSGEIDTNITTPEEPTGKHGKKKAKKVKEKKKGGKLKVIGIIVAVLLVLGIIGSIGGDDTTTTEDTTADTQTEEVVEEEEEVKTPLDLAREAGINYFTSINWDKVFTYGADIHYIMDYSCVPSENPERGKWLCIASADLKNAFGAEFSSYVGLYLDEDLNIQSCYYTDATGEDVEIPID